MTAQVSSNDARDAAVGIVRRLRRAGHVAYLAGGCVRDRLLGVEPKDFDVATEARPEVVRGLFKRSQYVGEAFGVVLVYPPRPRDGGNAAESGGRHPGAGLPAGVEVATFRAEWGYEDGRRPDRVEFTDAEHDAQRRDFTVNGLFADPLDDALEPVPPGEEKVIDYVGGVADLQAKVLRAIGVAAERFGEDYLRMLRAARFAARLGFEIEAGTAEAIRAHADKLRGISRERIGQEVRLMLTGSDPVRAAELIEGLGLDGPALNGDCLEVEHGTLAGVTGDEADYALALTAWMLDRARAGGSLEEVARYAENEALDVLGVWRKALCLSNEDRDGMARLMRLIARAHGWDGLSVAKRKRLLAEPGWDDALRLMRVVGPGDVIERIEAEALPLMMAGVAPERFVNGDDLLEMGVPAGPRVGELLEGVYDAQLEGRVKDREAGLAWVKRHL